MSAEKGHCLAVDIGGSTWSVASGPGPIPLVLGRGVTTDDPEATLAALAAAIPIRSDRRSLGCAFAGAVDGDGRVTGWPNRPAWRGFPLGQRLRSALDVTELHIDDDGFAAARGEAQLGAGRHHDDLLVVTLGTGIGGAVVLDRTVRRPVDTGGRTLGHLRALSSAARCRCGRTGCLQTALATLPAPGSAPLHWPQGRQAFDVLADLAAVLGLRAAVVCGGLMMRRDVRTAVVSWLDARGVECLVPPRPADSSLLGALVREGAR